MGLRFANSNNSMAYTCKTDTMGLKWLCLCGNRIGSPVDVSKPYATGLSEASVAEVLAAKAVETKVSWFLSKLFY